MVASLCVALFVSLSVNVFFLGVFVGSSVSGTEELSSNLQQENIVSGAVVASTDAHLKSSLSGSDKKIVRQVMRKYKMDLKAKKEAWMKSRRALKHFSVKGEFDQNKYQDLSREERQKFSEMRMLMGQLWEEVTPQLSSEGRATMVSMHENGSKMKLLHGMRKQKSEGNGAENRDQRRERLKRFREKGGLNSDRF